MLESVICGLILFCLFAIGVLIGDYVIPFIITLLYGKPISVRNVEHADKDWAKIINRVDNGK